MSCGLWCCSGELWVRCRCVLGGFPVCCGVLWGWYNIVLLGLGCFGWVGFAVRWRAGVGKLRVRVGAFM